MLRYKDMPGSFIRWNGKPFRTSDGGRASRATDLGACMERAFAVAGPALVEVDIEAIGPIPRYFQPPPHATRDED